MWAASLSIFALLTPVAISEALTPRLKPEEYPVRASTPKMTIAAEYQVHSVRGRQRQMFAAEDHLVVETACYPARSEKVVVSIQHFSLRVNGKTALLAQTPGFVAASMKYPDWERKPSVVAGAGPVLIGRPQSVPRFPGDNRVPTTPMPNPPKTPNPADASGVDPEPVESGPETVIATGLEEGEITKAIAGHLYFPFRGKTKSIKSLELIYHGPAGDAVLKLQ